MSVKEGFPLQSSDAHFILVFSFQTTPSPVSACWVSFFPSLCFSPITVCLFCLLCSMWALSDASKLVKPESEAHTAQCLHRKSCGENLVWLSCSDSYITVCLFSRTLSQVTKPLSKCERFAPAQTPAQNHIYTHVYVCFLNLCGSVCDPRLECHADFYPLTPQPATRRITSWWMSGCTKPARASVVEVLFTRPMMVNTEHCCKWRLTVSLYRQAFQWCLCPHLTPVRSTLRQLYFCFCHFLFSL